MDASEAHGNQLVDAFLVDLQELIDHDGVCPRIDGAETVDRVASLDGFTLGDPVGQGDEDFAGLFRIPHEAARQRAALDELGALPRRERADDEDLAVLAAFFNRAAGADRTLRTEGQEAGEIGVGRHQVEGGGAALVEILGKRRSDHRSASSRDSWP